MKTERLITGAALTCIDVRRGRMLAVDVHVARKTRRPWTFDVTINSSGRRAACNLHDCALQSLHSYIRARLATPFLWFSTKSQTWRRVAL